MISFNIPQSNTPRKEQNKNLSVLALLRYKAELSSVSAQTKLMPFGCNSTDPDLDQTAHRVAHEKRLCLLKILAGQDGFPYR